MHTSLNHSDKKVSIIIPCYNYGHYLEECIESCLAQTYPNFEIIVVDDGSTDNTEVVAKQYPVKYLYQVNKGLPSARNLGIQNATGERILCLDADDKIDPTYLEKTVNIPGIVVVGVKNFDKAKAEVLPYHNLSLESFKIQNRITCCSMFDKKDWEAIGGFDETLRTGREDWDFWLRMLSSGVSITPLNECLFYYRIHGVTMSRKADAQEETIHNYIKKKNARIFG